ncbi:mediator of RNA polymerase II transcription subunit 9-like isoform X2 [Camponotus floridanus]|uniref:mediator of RNA polymerase II transcription subunit 9-like isoform X2 n=1 Tax=Camponotus floridanus TaxID=104421 RepID=UPI000DC6AF91|nr:mediator of RNA polymerase II transcription subunit 9-like isoform X2 [Camponotus floridanus]XP_025266207.1 mediator of RNA polymerase II transcription subunit 9-like isoform X2 [Camponotus floridanus]
MYFLFVFILTRFMHQRHVCCSCVEKDPHDTTQKAKESQDTSHKILELQKKLDSIKRLSGIEYSQEEQLQRLEISRQQLRLKRELLLKYRNMCTFEIPKI